MPESLRSWQIGPLPRALLGSGPALWLGACNHSPSQDIMGSFFPSWLLCLGLGICAAALCRWLLGLIGAADAVMLPLVAYPAAALAVTCLAWLSWFGG